MAAPSIFWYPQEGGPIKELRCGYSLQKLSARETFMRPTTTNGIGTPWMTPLQGGLRVTLRKERMLRDTDKDMISDFYALENHLRRGGSVGIALDRTKAFAAYVTTGLVAGGTTIEGGPNVYKSILVAQSITLALADGDRFCLESGNPDWRRERIVASGSPTVTAFAHSITSSRGIVYDRDASAGVMIRYEDFYPAVYLPEDQLDVELMTDESGALYTFEAELQVDPSVYGAGVEQDLGPFVLPAPDQDSSVVPVDPYNIVQSTLTGLTFRPTGGTAGLSAAGNPRIQRPSGNGFGR